MVANVEIKKKICTVQGLYKICKSIWLNITAELRSLSINTSAASHLQARQQSCCLLQLKLTKCVCVLRSRTSTVAWVLPIGFIGWHHWLHWSCPQAQLLSCSLFERCLVVCSLGVSFHFSVSYAKRSQRDGSKSVPDEKKRSLTHFRKLWSLALKFQFVNTVLNLFFEVWYLKD